VEREGVILLPPNSGRLSFRGPGLAGLGSDLSEKKIALSKKGERGKKGKNYNQHLEKMGVCNARGRLHGRNSGTEKMAVNLKGEKRTMTKGRGYLLEGMKR